MIEYANDARAKMSLRIMFRNADHEKRSQIVTSKAAGGGGKMGFPSPSGFPCSEHFGRKVANITIYKLGVADPNPISKSKFDLFL